MKNSHIHFDEIGQMLFRLSHTITTETRRRLVLIPDRDTAQIERDKLKRQHGSAMIAANIRKQGKRKAGTYTLAYTLRESHMEHLF